MEWSGAGGGRLAVCVAASDGFRDVVAPVRRETTLPVPGTGATEHVSYALERS